LDARAEVVVLILQRVHELVRQRRFPLGAFEVGGEVHRLVLRLVKARQLRAHQVQQRALVVELRWDRAERDQHLPRAFHHLGRQLRPKLPLNVVEHRLARDHLAPDRGLGPKLADLGDHRERPLNDLVRLELTPRRLRQRLAVRRRRRPARGGGGRRLGRSPLGTAAKKQRADRKQRGNPPPAHAETASRIAPIAARRSGCPNTADPATNTSAPARTIAGAVAAVTPPSTSRSMLRPLASIIRLSDSSFGSTAGRNSCPPNPGFTLMTRIRSRSSSTYRIVSSGVCGFNTTPARAPRRRISDKTRCKCVQASTCTLSVLAPASTKSLRYFSGS